MPHLENEDLVGTDKIAIKEAMDYLSKEFAEEDLALVKRWEHIQLQSLDEED